MTNTLATRISQAFVKGPAMTAAARLLRDDPRWTYQAATGPAARRLRVWRTEPGRLVAVVTERGPGMSVTNAAALVPAQLAAEYPDDVIEVIEHYPARMGWPDLARLHPAALTAVLGADVCDQPAGN